MTDKFCTGCKRDAKKRKANLWCVHCCEFVCKPCSKVHKRLLPPHEIIPIDKINDKCCDLCTISKFCLFHKTEELTFFCCQHDELVCDICLSESHSKCKPLLSISTASDDIIHGTALTDLERRLENLRKFAVVNGTSGSDRHLRQEEMKKEIVKDIANVKKNIIDHLDEMERVLVKDIDQILEKQDLGYSKVTENIRPNIDLVESWKNCLCTMKEHASKMQLFIVVKLLDKKVHAHELYIQRFNDINLHTLRFNPSDQLTNIKSVITSLGSITVERDQAASLDLEQQGQVFIKPRESKLLLESSFETGIFGNNIKTYEGCLISGDKVLLVPSEGNFLIYCKNDGSESRKLELPYRPSCVALYDDDHSLVTSNDDFIQVIHLSSLTLGTKIKVDKQCTRIVCKDDKIWFLSGYNVLSQTDINGKVENKIYMSFSPNGLCTHPSGSLYCTNSKLLDQNVYIISKDREVEKIYCNPDLVNPIGVTADDRGDLFIAGYGHGNIHKISHNGKQSAIILSQKDSIRGPTRLDYSSKTKKLMIIHRSGSSVNIYKVI